jgi:hypothetical protein
MSEMSEAFRGKYCTGKYFTCLGMFFVAFDCGDTVHGDLLDTCRMAKVER